MKLVVLFSFLVLFLFVVGCGEDVSAPHASESLESAVLDSDVKTFNVRAFRFGYDPAEIRVKKGDRVRIVIDNSDTLHGIRFPELGVSDMDVIEFTANEVGTFNWRCNNYCGEDHMKMGGLLIVE
jgi:cytochrome c oxidase subunit II